MVRLARVRPVQVPSGGVADESAAGTVAVQVGLARVEVLPGFDRATFAGVMEILMSVAGRR